MKFDYWKRKKGFTLVEVLIVISIIGLLSAIAMVSIRTAKEKSKVAQAGAIARNIRLATEFYYDDMGFYPPDVNRGWDPGFMQALPRNPDTGDTTLPSCDHCPPNWNIVAQAKWRGPYLRSWPNLTPWNGKYDYNYWDSIYIRYGCIVPAGIYIGVQGDYSDNNTIPSYAEQSMLNQKYDSDGCLNGESQMLLMPL
jgi:prepilin-type N-terminal cleavage/methylation domain-containing protein